MRLHNKLVLSRLIYSPIVNEQYYSEYQKENFLEKLKDNLVKTEK